MLVRQRARRRRLVGDQLGEVQRRGGRRLALLGRGQQPVQRFLVERRGRGVTGVPPAEQIACASRVEPQSGRLRGLGRLRRDDGELGSGDFSGFDGIIEHRLAVHQRSALVFSDFHVAV